MPELPNTAFGPKDKPDDRPRDERLGEALADPQPEDNPEDRPEDNETPTPDEGEELFADSSDEGEDLFDEPDEDESDEVEGEGDEKKVPLKTFKKRVDKLTAKLYALREELAKERGSREAIEREYAQAKQLAEVFQAKYGHFKDPKKQALWDASFMEAAEELSKTNPEVRQAITLITNNLGGDPLVTDPKPIRPEENTPTPDPRLDAILKRDASRTIHETLTAVKPSFRNVIANHILSQQDVDLASLDAPTVKKLASSFIRDNGFTREEVLAKPTKSEPKEEPKEKKKRPATAGHQANATRERAVPDSEQQPPGPKTRNEWEANRAARLRQVAGDLGLE